MTGDSRPRDEISRYLDEAVREHGVGLRRFIRQLRFNFDHATQEDIAQQVWTEFVNHVRRSGPGDVLKQEAYLYRITSHVALRFAKQRGLRAQEAAVRCDDAEPGDSSEQPHEDSEDLVIVRAQLREAVAKLAEPYRSFMLLKMDGKTYEQIAALMECSRAKVGRVLEEARARMTRHLGPKQGRAPQ